MKFMKLFKRREPVSTIDKSAILKIVDRDTLRVSYKNIFGDEESCYLKDFHTEPRSTGGIKDITRLYLYDGGNLKYVIRIESNQLVYWQLDSGKKNNDIVSIDKSFVDDVLNMISEI